MENNTTQQRHLVAAFWQIVLVALMTINVQAQNKVQVTGKISMADKTNLPGVSILIKGTTVGTVSDAEGRYRLEANANDYLVFSFIGMETTEVAINGRSTVDLVMNEDVQTLSEVVVVGYGTQKKSHLTGSVAQVTNEGLDQIPLSRIDDALNGQLAGVTIQQTNPVAGGAPTIYVRGVGSITGSSSPLVVVDGIVVGSDYLSSIDMNDVASVEVLKDASSVAIYGSRGANGVIMISTKKGKGDGQTRLSYNMYMGYKTPVVKGLRPTIDEWADFVKENNGGVLTPKMDFIKRLGTETDWEDVMMDGGMIQSHSISASGGTDKTKFRASGNYVNDEGVLATDGFEKINLRLNLDTKINDRVDFGIMVNPSFSKQRVFPIGLEAAIRQSSWLPLYVTDDVLPFINGIGPKASTWKNFSSGTVGDYAVETMFDNYDLENNIPLASGGTTISTTSDQNNYAKVMEEKDVRYETKIFFNTYLGFKLLDGLTAKISFGGDYRYQERRNYQGRQATNAGYGGANALHTTTGTLHTVTEATLSYQKKFDKHELSAVGGFGYEHWGIEGTSIAQSSGYETDYVETIFNSAAGAATTFRQEEALVSVLGRINYAYSDKYLVSLSARSDGSSKFGKNTKYGLFPAASIGWVITEENFIPESNLITFAKARFSYGFSGSNSGIGRYASQGLMLPVSAVLNGVVTPGGYNQSNIASPDLGWEKLVEFNPGLDVELFGGKLAMSFDYYNRRSQDLLLNRPVPSSTGFTQALINLGEVENKGFEVELTSRNILVGDFSWSSSATVTRNKNTLISFPGSNNQVSVIDSKRASEWIAREGQPISSFYGYVYKKDIPSEFITDPFYPIGAKPRDVYVRDLNGDGVIDGGPDSQDKTILGNPYPKVILSLTNNIKYKSFDLSFMFQSALGAKVRNMDPQYMENHFASSQLVTSSFPDAAFIQQKIYTDQIIMDASYLALRNLNLGYSFSKAKLGKSGIRNARVYVSAQNLLYVMAADYIGYNPEGIFETTGVTNSDPTLYGYQRGAAPLYKTYSIGVNLEF